MLAAKPNLRAHLTRPTSRPASRFAKRELVPGFLRCAPRARAWSRCSQVADLHQGNRLHRYESASGCVVAPNKSPKEIECDQIFSQVQREGDLADRTLSVYDQYKAATPDVLALAKSGVWGFGGYAARAGYSAVSAVPWAPLAAGSSLDEAVMAVEMARQGVADLNMNILGVAGAENMIDGAVNALGVVNSVAEVGSTAVTHNVARGAATTVAGRVARVTPFISAGLGFYGVIGTTENYAQQQIDYGTIERGRRDVENALFKKAEVHNGRSRALLDLWYQKGCDK